MAFLCHNCLIVSQKFEYYIILNQLNFFSKCCLWKNYGYFGHLDKSWKKITNRKEKDSWNLWLLFCGQSRILGWEYVCQYINVRYPWFDFSLMPNSFKCEKPQILNCNYLLVLKREKQTMFIFYESFHSLSSGQRDKVFNFRIN